MWIILCHLAITGTERVAPDNRVATLTTQPPLPSTFKYTCYFITFYVERLKKCNNGEMNFVVLRRENSYNAAEVTLSTITSQSRPNPDPC